MFGLLFLGIAGIWALGTSDVISGEHLAVLGPGVLILAGVVGLAASLANGRNRRRSANRPATRPTATTPPRYDNPTYDSTTDTTTDHVADDGDDPTEEIR